ncbi:MAG: hypothetical protein HWN66_06445 [Candidatus Helarchaeota archaeon]|nr:hypothetical protein [Candidatus Helarchaeota archaeon]
MLKNVLIFWTHGTLLYSRSYGIAKKDPHLVSGFLSAFSNFAKELGEKEIRAIQMHPHKIFMSIHQDLCFTISLDQDDEEAQGELILQTLINSFLAIFGVKLEPEVIYDLDTFNEFETMVDDLYIIKNFFELIESTNKKLSLPDLQKMYEEKFGSSIPLTKCWQCLNFLVMNDAIVEVSEKRQIRYRKKGELLKGLDLKFKK